jgi:hypothetical protein
VLGLHQQQNQSEKVANAHDLSQASVKPHSSGRVLKICLPQRYVALSIVGTNQKPIY